MSLSGINSDQGSHNHNGQKDSASSLTKIDHALSFRNEEHKQEIPNLS